MNQFKESDHHRDSDGKFTNKNTSSSSVAIKEEVYKYTDKIRKYKNKTKCYFNDKEIEQLKSNPNIVVLNHDITLKEFIQQSLKKENSYKKLVISPISKQAINLVKENLNYNISNLEIGIDSNDLKHIFKNHGDISEYNRGQIPITEDNFELIIDCINNPTDVLFGNNKTIFFLKKDKQNILKITSVTYMALKKQSLMIKTAYFHKLKEK